MGNKVGKLFQDTQTKKVIAYEYIDTNQYYSFVENIRRKGNTQCIFTLDIMLKYYRKK